MDIWPEPRDGEEMYGFQLCLVHEPGTREEWFDVLGEVRVQATEADTPDLPSRLHHWAIATLEAGSHPFGRYSVACASIDETGEVNGHCLAETKLFWSGTTELTTPTT